MLLTVFTHSWFYTVTTRGDVVSEVRVLDYRTQQALEWPNKGRGCIAHLVVVEYRKTRHSFHKEFPLKLTNFD